MKKLILFPVLVLFALVSLSDAGAVVRVVDATNNTALAFPAFNSAIVNTVSEGGMGDPNAGDYILLFCSNESVPGNQNFFDLPTPGNWTELDDSQCGNDGCVKGIWGRFADSSSNEFTECNWDVGQNIFAGGTFRYADVDRSDPIIDIACQSGTGSEATAPSIVSEPGAQVVRAATYSNPTIGFQCPSQADEVTMESIFACANAEIANVVLDAFTETDLDGGPTGEASLELPEPQMDWRACTIALRMTTGVRPIPTMSEWGFLAVAVFMGAAGVWYLRRRQAA